MDKVRISPDLHNIQKLVAADRNLTRPAENNQAGRGEPPEAQKSEKRVIVRGREITRRDKNRADTLNTTSSQDVSANLHRSPPGPIDRRYQPEYTEHGSISLADQGRHLQSRSEELAAIKANMPDINASIVTRLHDHIAAKLTGVWTTSLAVGNGDISKKNVTLVGSKHTDSQVAPEYRAKANWQYLKEFDRHLQTTRRPLLLVESGSPENNQTGSVTDFARSCTFYTEWTEAIFASRGTRPPDPHDLTPVEAAFTLNEMNLLRYLVVHRVDPASLHQAVENGDLSRLRFASNERIPMQAWDPSNAEIISHLKTQGLEPRDIALEQASKHVSGLIRALSPAEKQLPTQPLFEALTEACETTGWQREEASRSRRIVSNLTDMPLKREKEMQRAIDRILKDLNPEMERLSARLGLGPNGRGFRLADRTEQGYMVSWEPRDPDSFYAVFNPSAGMLDPESTLQYASYLNIEYRHKRAPEMLHLAIAAGYEPFGIYQIIHAIPLAVAVGRATKQDIHWSACE